MGSIEVRGHSRFERQASLFLLFLAGIADFAAGVLIACEVYSLAGWDPAPDWKVAPVLAASVLVPWILARWIFKRSLGEWLWKTREGKTGVRERADELRAAVLTLILLGISGFFLKTSVLDHPYWSTDIPLFIEDRMPPVSWKVLSFYYTMAPWPTEVAGKPVFYWTPYEFGPPQRFLGHVESNWITDSVRVSFEGPKTPLEFQSRALTRKMVHECFITLPWLAPSCAQTRSLVLERHLAELRGLGYAKFRATWFSSENQAIPPEERAQGVLIRATSEGSGVGHGETRVQDRFILITPTGLHQGISISYSENPEGLKAREMFLTSLGMLRISEDLSQGRAWTDKMLASTSLANLPQADDPKYLQNLAEIQALLVSKITLDPGSFDPYYHLAGANLLLLKYCVKHPEPGLSSLAQAMVERMDRFAHDVAPHHPRMPELDRLRDDAKQF